MTTAPKFSPGDHVRDRYCQSIPGVLRSHNDEYAVVRWEGKIVDSEIHIDNLRRETPEETAKREHIEAYRAWCAKQPTSRHVGVRWNNAAVYVGDLSSPEDMRQTAAELLQFADWFAERPKS